MFNNLILSILKEIRGLYLLSLLLVFLEVVFFLETISLQKELIDSVFTLGNYSRLPNLLFFFGVSFILYAVFFTVTPHIFHLNAGKLRIILAEKVADRLNVIPISKLNKMGNAKIVHYFNNDIEVVAWALANHIPRGIQEIIKIILLLILIGNAGSVIFISMVVASVFLLILSKRYIPNIKKTSTNVMKQKIELNRFFEEGVSSTREVIGFNGIKWENERYNLLFNIYFNMKIIEGKLITNQKVISQIINWGSKLIILGYGGYLVINGELSIGTLVIVYQLISYLADGIPNLIHFYLNLVRQYPYFQRLHGLFKMEIIPSGNLKLDKKIKSISLKNVSFKYEDSKNYTLYNINMNLPINKKIAIVGASGSGKSTLIKLLLLFHEPTSGQIEINNVPIKKFGHEDWLRKLKVVFQEPYIFSDSIKNNLYLGRKDILDEDVDRICKNTHFHKVIEDLPDGYDTQVGERGLNLSGGQRQRLAIARYLMDNSPLLILDESTSALDIITEREIQNNLDLIRKNKTTIIIAHRLSTIKNADIIFVLEKGQIVGQGTHEFLMEQNLIYRSLVQADLVMTN